MVIDCRGRATFRAGAASDPTVGVMRSVPSMLYVLQSTLRRLEGSEEFPADNPHVQELKRSLLIAIADLEEQRQEQPAEARSA